MSDPSAHSVIRAFYSETCNPISKDGGRTRELVFRIDVSIPLYVRTFFSLVGRYVIPADEQGDGKEDKILFASLFRNGMEPGSHLDERYRNNEPITI